MLHVEHPDPYGTGYRHGCELNRQPRKEPENGDQDARQGDHGKVHQPYRTLFAWFGFSGGESFENNEQENGSEKEQNAWVSNESVGQFLPPGGLKVFLHRQGPDVSYASLA